MKKLIVICFFVFCLCLTGCKKIFPDKFDEQIDHVHKYETVFEKNTCTENGYIKKICECGNSYIESEIKASHEFKTIVVEPTCMNQGYTEYSCNNCEYSYIDNYVNPLGHSLYCFKKEEPTCLESGYEEYKCTRCYESVVIMISPLEHNLQVYDGKNPTCTVAGYNEYEKCSQCDYTTYEEIPAKGHSYEVSFVEPTCTKKGYTLYKCYCGHSYSTEFTDPIGHDLVFHELKAATCTEKGIKKYTCTRCNYVSDGEIQALGHDYKINESPATCGSNGEKITTCSRCDYYNKETLPAKGHNKVVDKAVEATCDSTGLTEGSHCSNCNWIFTPQTVIMPINHEYSNGSCKKCNATEGLMFTLNDLQTGYIVSAGSAKYKSEFFIPSYYNGKPVVEIEENGFSNYYSNRYVKIVLPNTIEKIGSDAFKDCDNLKTVYFSGTVEDWLRVQICDSTLLSNCEEFYLLNQKKKYEKIVELVIPNTITSINKFQFAGYKSLEKVYIPSNVLEIGTLAFYNCISLKTVEIEEGLTVIRDRAFVYCSALNSITLPKTLKTIEQYAFQGCISLSNIIIPDNVTTIGLAAFFECENLETIVLPSKIIFINNSTFLKCYKLSKIVIPDNVVSIGQDAFAYCSSLKEVVIPNGLYKIADGAFDNSGILDVFYKGTVDQWGKIIIGDKNEELVSATLHYNFNDFTEHSHIYTVTVIEKTCTTDGYTEYKCECGHVQINNIIKAGHVERILVAREATCTRDGVTEGKDCSACGIIFIPQEVIVAPGHEYNKKVIRPTCEYKGYTLYLCKCGSEFSEDYVEALGHNEVIISGIEPTCYSEGLSEGKKCSTCDKVLVEQEILQNVGHSFVDHYCIWCSYEEEYVVSFFNNEMRISTQILKYSEEYTVPNVTKTGYRFVEWKESDNPTYPPIPIGYDYFEYYAVWIKCVTLQFDLDGGSAINPIMGYTTDYQFETLDKGLQRLIPYDANKKGYEFIGWIDQDGNEYSKGDSFTVNKDMIIKANYISLSELYKSDHIFNFQDYDVNGNVKIVSGNEYFDKYDLYNADVLKQYGYTKAKITIRIPVESFLGQKWSIKVLIDGEKIESLSDSGHTSKTVELTYNLDLKYCDDYKEDYTNDIKIMYEGFSDLPWFLGVATIEVEYQK